MGILVIGSVALDTVTTPFGSMTDGLGGSATHFSVSASYFTKVSMVAVVGTDFPHEHVEFLKSRDIDVSGLETVPGKTFRWRPKAPHSGNRQIHKTERRHDGLRFYVYSSRSDLLRLARGPSGGG